MKQAVFLFSSIILTFCSSAQCTTSGTSLATLYNSDNSNKGVMFDIVATNTITLLCFDVNLIGFSTGTFEIYYKSGTYVGSQSNAAAWTMIGSNSVTALGINNPSPVGIPLNVVIPAGQTYGFYITNNDNTLPAGVRYTNGASITLASDANISVVGGLGKAYPFGNDFLNRRFNGTVHYVPGNVLPVELIDFEALNKDREVVLNWKTESENNNNHFTVDRSTDGDNWTIVSKVPSKGNATSPQSYQLTDKQPQSGITYYRLRQTDNDGTETQFEIIAVQRDRQTDGELTVFPNPAENHLTVIGSEDELSTLYISDITGRDISSEITITYEPGMAKLDLSRIPGMTVILKAGSRTALVIRN